MRKIVRCDLCPMDAKWRLTEVVRESPGSDTITATITSELCTFHLENYHLAGDPDVVAESIGSDFRIRARKVAS